MDVMVKKFDIRLRYSQPMGYWNTEVGGLFQVVHIWEYGRLSLSSENSSSHDRKYKIVPAEHTTPLLSLKKKERESDFF